MSLFSNFQTNKKVSDFTENQICSSITLSFFNNLGYTETLESINNSILSLLIPSDSSIVYTEQYFYEESAFYLMALIEAQESYGVIDNVVNAINNDPGQGLETTTTLGRKIENKDIIKSIQSTCSILASSRIEVMNLKQIMTPLQIIEFLDESFSEYRDKQVAHITCAQPINVNWGLGFSARKHPSEIYFGAITDNIASSVNISKTDSLSSFMLLEMAVMGMCTESLQSILKVYGN